MLRRIFYKVERQAVHAVPLAGRRRTVGEQVPQVRSTAPAAHLGADHAVAAILDQVDGVGRLGLEEAGPSAARLELGVRVEQFGPARRAVIRAIGMLVDVLPTPRSFGAGMT